MKLQHNHGVKTRSYLPGDDISVRLKGKDPPWVPAVVLQNEGQQVFLKVLSEGNSNVVQRHLDNTK